MLKSRRKEITVLFIDLRGFTALSETLDAEEVRDTMNALWASVPIRQAMTTMAWSRRSERQRMRRMHDHSV